MHTYTYEVNINSVLEEIYDMLISLKSSHVSSGILLKSLSFGHAEWESHSKVI
jgi:hypothetical protein